MSTKYIIQGFKRQPKGRHHDTRVPGAFFTMEFEYQSDAEAIYKRVAPLFKDYELEMFVRTTSTTREIIAGNAAFVANCRTWGKTGPHASWIAPASAGHKRITTKRKG